jgi:uncharacterized membrane protein YgcG
MGKTGRFLLFVLLVLTLTAFMAPLAAQALDSFRITNYDIAMDVRDDNSYKITETIDVIFTSPLHGIFRTIPLKTYRGYRATITDISVPGLPYTTSSTNGNLEIKIGDASYYAPTTQRYVISYLYTIGADRLTQMDELYYNLIGTEWNVNIDKVTFDITMPSAFDATKLNFTSGASGSTDNSAVSYAVTGNEIKGKMLKPLGPNEALTVALVLPEGYYANAKTILTLADYFFKYFLLIFAAILGLAIFVWLGLGRNGKIYPVVEFNAPEGMTSADIGYIYDGIVHPRDITSLLIYWAGKGHLTITEGKTGILLTKNTYTFTKVKDLAPEAKEYEKTMFSDLFDKYGDGTKVTTEDLRYKFYVTMDKVKSMIIASYAKDEQSKVFNATGPLAKGLLTLIALAAAYFTVYTMYMITYNDTATEIYILIAVFAFLMFATVKILSNLIFTWPDADKVKRFGTAISTIIWFLIFIFVMFSITSLTDFGSLLFLGMVVTFAIAHMTHYCVKRTTVGNEYMNRIAGLKDFIVNVEEDRIKVLADENPSYFYNILPYAIAFGIAEKWAAKFANITVQPPDWYQTNYPGGMFTTMVFVHSLNESVHDVSGAMTSKVQSSGTGSFGGSMGGGFSGGGSGGGGGGGW